ncbi:PleD family two-component system response regulator [Lacibacterium aquatile]|uniref:PleD family two-component system response regulator n=1 Tax=Lacibacterium aquatile TaxID=1168082 RepID=A0ABW5DRJ0_9PROT
MSKGIVVLADDERVLLQTYSAALKTAGYFPMAVRSGQEVLDLLHRVSPRLVVLDVNMPNLNGYTVCSRIRERLGDDLPIVFVTALDGMEALRDALSAGGDDFIRKRDTLSSIMTRLDLWARRPNSGGRERRVKLLQQVRQQLGDTSPIDQFSGRPVKKILPDDTLSAATEGVEVPEGAREIFRDARYVARVEYGADKREQTILLGYALGVVETYAKDGQVAGDKLFGTWMKLLEPSGALSDMSVRTLLGERQELVSQEIFKTARLEGRKESEARLQGQNNEAWGLGMLILGRSVAASA